MILLLWSERTEEYHNNQQIHLEKKLHSISGIDSSNQIKMVDSSNLYIHNHKLLGCFYSYSEIKNIMHGCPSKTKGFEEHVGGATVLWLSTVALLLLSSY